MFFLSTYLPEIVHSDKWNKNGQKTTLDVLPEAKLGLIGSQGRKQQWSLQTLTTCLNDYGNNKKSMLTSLIGWPRLGHSQIQNIRLTRPRCSIYCFNKKHFCCRAAWKPWACRGTPTTSGAPSVSSTWPPKLPAFTNTWSALSFIFNVEIDQP